MTSTPIPPLTDPLPAEVLAARATLPAKPAAVTLTGPTVELRPVDLAADGAELFAISDGSPVERRGRAVPAYDAEERVWRYMPVGPFADAAALAAFLAALAASPDARTLVAVDRASGQLLGSASFLANRPDDLKVELGAIWYTPAVQGTSVNAEATHLMVDHAVALGYRRVEWKCNADNLRSRQAALRLGFTFEGIQEGHMIAKDRNRDTAWFRILAAEWPAIRAAATSLG